MARLTFLIGVLLVVAALALVTSQHRARKLFIELERTQAAARQLDVEWNQLQLQQTQLTKHSLIDAAARRDLKMQPVSPARTLYLLQPGADAPGAATQAR